jgi:hypothetical protein
LVEQLTNNPMLKGLNPPRANVIKQYYGKLP